MGSVRAAIGLRTCLRSDPFLRSQTLNTSSTSGTSVLKRTISSVIHLDYRSSCKEPHHWTVSSSSSSSASFSTSSWRGKAENYYNPYDIAETPEEAAELEPPVRYYKDTRFDEPDYDMPKNQVRALYAEHQPADLFTDFEISRDPVEWSYVERLLAPAVVPPPPPHPQYPTASGWTPPKPDPTLTWRVKRKKDHHYDITVDQSWKTKAGAPGMFQVTTVGGIEGDIWAFHREAKAYLMTRLPAPQKWQKRRPQEVETTVDEWASKIGFKGIFDQQLKEFLLSKGM